MHYGMPGTYFTNNTPTSDNYELSETDKQFISDLYPKTDSAALTPYFNVPRFASLISSSANTSLSTSSPIW